MSVLHSPTPAPIDRDEELRGASLPGATGGLPRAVALFTETFVPRINGVVTTLCWLLRGLRAAGCTPLVVAPAGSAASFEDVPVLGANSVPLPLYPEVRLAFSGPGIFRTLDEFQPELIHLVDPIVNGLSGALYARSRGLPTIASYHTNLPAYASAYALGAFEQPLWRLLRTIYNGCGATLCPSRAVMAELHHRGFHRLRLWSRGVDTTLFNPARRSREMRARLGGDQARVVLLYVGRLAREKCLEQLVRVLEAVPQAILAIVGDGPHRGEIERAFAGRPARLLGVMTGPELAAAYASADVFVFPSPSETLGNVVLEAMASGLPVVAPAAGGVVDNVEPGVTGLLYAPADHAGLVAHTARYVDDEELRRRHGLAGLAVARGRTWQRQQELLVHHYRSVLRARRQPVA